MTDVPAIKLSLPATGTTGSETASALADAVQRGDALRLLLARALLLVQLVAQPLDVLQRLVDAVRSWEGREQRMVKRGTARVRVVCGRDFGDKQG